MRRNKFKKELNKANEIKGNKSKPYLIKYMLNKLNGVTGARVFSIYLNKERYYSSYLNADKHKLLGYLLNPIYS
jgi:hypothetical protein